MSEVKQWPDLVGKNVEEAKNTILESDPSINISVVPQGQPLTRDFRMNRVRIFVDQGTQSIVQSVPRRG